MLENVCPCEPIDRNEVLAIIRELFATGGRRDGEQTLHELAAALGYQRLGPRIRDSSAGG